MVLLFKYTIPSAIAIAILLCCIIGAMPVAAESAMPTSVAASGAVLYEPQSGRVLFEQQAHVKRPMASTTKLMTALVAAESLSLKRSVTVKDEALRVIGTSMGLCSGDVLTVEDLLKGLLLSSGNDAANVLALETAGSLEAFAQQMNDRAARIGMTDTRFVTPSGLDADGHGSTPYDMALLAAEVLDHPILADICAMRQATVTISGRSVTLTNHNKLLARYDGAIGMKTGFTTAAGRCLVSAAHRNGVTLIAVTLHCADDWQVHTALLDAGFAQTRCVTMPEPSLTALPVFGGQLSEVSVSVSVPTAVVLTGQEHAVETAVRLSPYIWAPVRQGEAVGRVVYRLNGEVIAEAPITADKDVRRAEPLGARERFIRVLSALVKQALTE